MTPRNLAALLVTATFILLAEAAFAQGTSTGSAGLGVPTGTTSLPGPTDPNNPKPATATAPLFLTGHVAIDDGSALPKPATIERVCNGVPHTEGYTDLKGVFSIQLGGQAGVFQDATDAPSRMAGPPAMGNPAANSPLDGMSGGSLGGPQDQSLVNCELRAKLAGFRSQSIALAGRHAMDNPDLGAILMHREAPGEKSSTVSATTVNAPKAARKAFEKGQELLKKNKLGEARDEFLKAVQIDQSYADAWVELGKLQDASNDRDGARSSFRAALKSDPKFVNPYLELSRLALNDKKWREAADLTDQALKLDSFDYPQAYLFNAAAKFNLQEVDAAEKSIKEADRLDTRHQYPEVAHLYGAILLYKKDYAGAVLQYHAYLKMAPNADGAPTVRKQLETLDKLTSEQK
jgi:tetratricopeptide (TPR) repeat protein